MPGVSSFITNLLLFINHFLFFIIVGCYYLAIRYFSFLIVILFASLLFIHLPCFLSIHPPFIPKQKLFNVLNIGKLSCYLCKS